ncbi:MAG TPA: mechanosensitive ion channel family protein [Allosphingosinicella sp.]|nr:mechanosensitive ion channel family protein [Allosphingosinicella sp.]
MTQKDNASVTDAAQNLSEKTVQVAGEASAWLTGNSVDILMAAAAGALIALILLGIRGFGHRLVRDRSEGIKWRTIVGRVLSRTTIFFILMCSAELVAEHAATPPPVLRAINILFVIAAAFQAAIWARELILGLVQHKVGEEESHSTLGSAIGIIRLLVTVALFTIAIILILDNLGVNVTGLVAGLGIGGIAIGLAAQGIFSDLFAALSIIFDKPFRKGDGIKVDQIQGTVEQIGLKTTRIRSLSGEEVVVSNAKLLDQQLHNFTNLEHRRFVLMLGVVYQTPPDVCANIPAMIRGIVERHADTSLVRCGMVNFGASSLDFELQFDVRTTDYEYAFATRSAICLEILAAFNEAGIQFAYPTQTSFTAAPDGTLVMPYPHVRMVATEDLESGESSL